MKRKINIFNLIAPVYSLFYKMQKKHYNKAVELLSDEFDLYSFAAKLNVIDVGCGTGALCSVLCDKGINVIGVDASYKMLETAIRKNKDNDIEFIKMDVLSGIPFEDKSFDVSFACHVAHGINSKERIKLYQELKRITKHLVIIHDYNDKKYPLTSFIEWMENGDYFNFIKVVKDELNDNFKSVEYINTNKQSMWYVCSL